MRIGHVCLAAPGDASFLAFAGLVEALEKLAIDQHVLVSDPAIARRLKRCPSVTVGPLVTSPVLACCLMPGVDLAHMHDEESGQAGLLLTLTRSIPFAISVPFAASSGPLQRSILSRAQRRLAPDDLEPDRLVEIYREILASWSELPKNADCR